MNNYPKRLIEVDLPIRALDRLRGRRTPRQDVDVRRPGTWWSRKPQHQCRAIWLAALLPDPADPLTSPVIVKALRGILQDYGMLSTGGSEDVTRFRNDLVRLCEYVAEPEAVISPTGAALLRELSVTLGLEATVTLDPFAGGGSIPIEALRLGANSIAGEYNPLAVLYLRYLLEWGPKAEDSVLEKVVASLRSAITQMRESLVAFYPPHPQFGQPVGYVRFRQLVCEGPGCGSTVPATSKFELNCRDRIGLVFSTDLRPGATLAMQLVKGPERGFPRPTIRTGCLDCPACHFTTKRSNVMRQCAHRVLPTLLVAAVYRNESKFELHPPTVEQSEAERNASQRLVSDGLVGLIPPQEWPKTEMRRFSPPLYGLKRFADCHTSRQQYYLAMLIILFTVEFSRFQAA